MASNYAELVIGNDVLSVQKTGVDQYHVALIGPNWAVKEDTYVSGSALADFVDDLKDMGA